MKKILDLIKRLLTQKSTYAGAAVIASVVGAPKLGVQIDQVGQAVGLIVGAAVAATDTSALNTSTE